MPPHSRPAIAADLPRCLALLRRSAAYDLRLEPLLPRVWEGLLQTGAIVFRVVEDGTVPRTLLGFGTTVFVTEAFAHEILHAPPLGLGAALYGRHRRGPSPILDRSAIARANAGPGLTLLSLHAARADMYSEPWRLPYGHSISTAFFDAHCGYRLRRLVMENHGNVTKAFCLNAGLRLLTEYADNPSVQARPERARPHLTVIERDEALRQHGIRVSALFDYDAPRFGLCERDQDILRHALDGAVNEDIARQTGLSVSTIKKAWAGLYKRVAAVDAMALYPPGVVEPPDRLTNCQRRRGLLLYVRAHPEELRPYISNSADAKPDSC